MKIAMVYDYIYPYHIGGIEIRNYEIARLLVKKGHEVHLFVVKLWGGPNILDKDGVIIHGVCNYKESEISGNRGLISSLKFSIKIIPEISKERFDLIICDTTITFPCFSLGVYSKLKNIPLVLVWQQYFRDYYYNYFRRKILGSFASFIERLTTKITKYNIAASDETKHELENLGMKNIFVSPNGINISEINNSKKMKQKYDVIFVGRLVYQKNPELLIKAINILRKNSPNIKVAIIGGGLEEEYLKKLVNNLGLERNIYFLGKIKNHIKIYPFLKSSLVFAHPSRAEGFSLVLLEAAACGLPIVTTNNKWNLSSVQFLKGNGIVSSENAEDFAKKINEILNNKILRNKMSKKSIKISKDFDWRNITDKLEEYYKRVLQK